MNIFRFLLMIIFSLSLVSSVLGVSFASFNQFTNSQDVTMTVLSAVPDNLTIDINGTNNYCPDSITCSVTVNSANEGMYDVVASAEAQMTLLNTTVTIDRTQPDGQIVTIFGPTNVTSKDMTGWFSDDTGVSSVLLRNILDPTCSYGPVRPELTQWEYSLPDVSIGSWAINIPLPHGCFYTYQTITDLAGNQRNSSRFFIVDQIAPNASFSISSREFGSNSPINWDAFERWNDGDFLVSGAYLNITDPEGITTTYSNKNFNLSLNKWGNYSFRIWARDVGGNEREEILLEETVDTTIPDVTDVSFDGTIVSAAINDLRMSSQQAIIKNRNGETVSIIELTYNNSSSKYQGTITIENPPVGETVFVIDVVAEDLSGNRKTYNNAGVFTVVSTSLINITKQEFNTTLNDEGLPSFNSSLTGQMDLTATTTSNLSNATINIVSYERPNWITNNTIGLVNLSKFFDFLATPEVEGAIQNAIIKIYYTDQEITNARINESSLRIYYYNETSMLWQVYDGEGIGGVNATENYVWANTTHFSLYAPYGSLMPEESSPPDNTPSSGSSGGGGDSSSRSDDVITIVKKNTTIIPTTQFSEAIIEPTKEDIEEVSEAVIEHQEPVVVSPRKFPTTTLVIIFVIILGLGLMIIVSRFSGAKAKKSNNAPNKKPQSP